MRAVRAVVLIALLAACALALKSKLKIRDDSRIAFKIEEFGFSTGGRFFLNATRIAVPAAGNVSRRAFVLTISETLEGGAVSDRSACDAVRDPERFRAQLWRVLPADAAIHAEKTVVETQRGYYHLFFANCAGGAVSMDIVLDQYNVDSKGHKNYLSAGDERTIPMFSVLSAAYGAALAGWCVLLWRRRSTSNRAHVLMAVLVVVKVLSLVFESIQLAYQAKHGERGGWAVPYFAFLIAKGMMVLIMIVLLGSGWAFLKPFLNKRDKTIILVVVPLQIIDNIALVFVEAAPPGMADWTTWKDILRVFDVICCAAVIIPIVWSIRHLRDASRTDGKAAISLQRLQVFREFYLIVVAYLYFQVILLLLLGLALPYYAAWVAPLCEEIVAIMFYGYVGWKFRPMPEQPQLVVEYEEGLGSINMTDVGDNDGGAVINAPNEEEPVGDETGRRHQQQVPLVSQQ